MVKFDILTARQKFDHTFYHTQKVWPHDKMSTKREQTVLIILDTKMSTKREQTERKRVQMSKCIQNWVQIEHKRVQNEYITNKCLQKVSTSHNFLKFI